MEGSNSVDGSGAGALQIGTNAVGSHVLLITSWYVLARTVLGPCL